MTFSYCVVWAVIVVSEQILFALGRFFTSLIKNSFFF